MAPITGNQSFVLFIKESTYGTPVTPTKDLGLIQNVTPTDNVTPNANYGLGSSAIQTLDWGRHEIGVRLDFDLQHGRIFELLTGGSITHVNTTSDWKHTYALSDTLPSATMEISHDLGTDAVSTYEGLKALSGTIRMDVNGILRCSADFAGQSVVTSTTVGTKVISALPVFKAHQATLATGVISSESTLADVQSFEWTINNVNSGDARTYKLGSRLVSHMEMQQRLITFRFSVAYSDLTEYKRMLGGSGGATSPTDDRTAITLNGLVFNAHNAVTLGSGRREIKIDMSNVLYANISRPVQVGSWVLAEIEGVCMTLDDFFTVDNIADTSF